MDFKEGDRIRVLIGVYTGKEGVVATIAPNAPKSVGVRVLGTDGVLPLTWFKPEEIEMMLRPSG